MEPMGIVASFAQQFLRELDSSSLVGPSWYNSFEYTRTGRNYCHSRTLGIIARVCLSLAGVASIDIDLHLNEGNGTKFQPDIGVLNASGQYLLLLDFESPNSSDARVPAKDIEAYLKWTRTAGQSSPYIVITSLPHQVNPRRPLAAGKRLGDPNRRKQWELRYTSSRGCNGDHKDYKDEIELYPFRYWYRFYRATIKAMRKDFPEIDKAHFYFANLNGLEFGFEDVLS